MPRDIRSAIQQKENVSSRPIRQHIWQQWRELWDHRIEDKLVAEDIARKTYDLLYIEKGTVIKATKDYQPPNLDDILRRNERALGLRLSYPDPRTGGWRKFSRDVLSKQPRGKIKREQIQTTRKHVQNALQRKRGRGWLNR